MIEPCSVNVLDLRIIREVKGAGGASSETVLAKGLRAHVEEGLAGSQSVEGRDVTVTNTLMIDGTDNDGDLIKVRAHDLAQWTDWKGELTQKLAIVAVTPFAEPGRGAGIGGIAHVRLDIGA